MDLDRLRNLDFDTDADPSGLSRRQLLALLGLGGAGAVGGASLLDDPPDTAETEEVADDEARRLAESYAPSLYFGRYEQWYPTDPRPYTIERDGETLVGGFEALDGYTEAVRAGEGPAPDPTVFYHAVDYPDSPLTCVQFWYYSVFDQFSTNFHWHDWEVLHAFVDTDAAAPVLFVASAHSATVPNNEFFDPATDRAAVVSEVGSHSSALSVNDAPATFQRYGGERLIADVSNDLVELVEGAAALPLAYGLPRDEGLRLPFVMPTLDGAPVHEHPNLPNVRREDLLAPEITVDSYADLAAPPGDLPTRESDLRFEPATRAGDDGDVRYDLVPIDALEGIDGLAGPRLSFSFYVPQFAEDAVAKHLTAPPLPWTQERFSNPELDITDPPHRRRLAERYAPIPPDDDVGQILGAIRQAVPADAAPKHNGLSLLVPGMEAVALLESDPTAVPTFSGALALTDVPAGEHRLTVNGAGLAPYAERLTVDPAGTPARAGVSGRVALTANEDAVKLRGTVGDRAEGTPTDERGTGTEAGADSGTGAETDTGTGTDGGSGLTELTIDEDFAGGLFEGRPPEPDRFGVYVHRAGGFTAEVRDAAGAPGAVRFNPDPDDEALDAGTVRTGKGPMVGYLLRTLTETRNQAGAFEDGTPDGLGAVATGQDIDETAIERAVERAAANVAELIPDRAGAPFGDDGGNADGTESTPQSGVPTRTEPARGDGTTPTPTATPTTSPTESGADGFDPGRGFDGLVRGLDGALVAAGRARQAVEAGREAPANRRLATLRSRLRTLQRVAEGDGLPPSLGRLVVNRVERLSPRVEVAMDASVE